jgi:hypothetical protein
VQRAELGQDAAEQRLIGIGVDLCKAGGEDRASLASGQHPVGGVEAERDRQRRGRPRPACNRRSSSNVLSSSKWVSPDKSL